MRFYLRNFRLTKRLPERINFVSRGSTVYLKTKKFNGKVVIVVILLTFLCDSLSLQYNMISSTHQQKERRKKLRLQLLCKHYCAISNTASSSLRSSPNKKASQFPCGWTTKKKFTDFNIFHIKLLLFTIDLQRCFFENFCSNYE